MKTTSVAGVDVGAIDSEDLDLMDQFGAVLASAKKPMALKFDPKLIAQLKQRAQAAKHPTMRLVLNGQAKMLARIREWEALRAAQATKAGNVAVPVCFDAIAAAGLTAVTTIGTPYNGEPWELCDIIVDPAQAVNFRAVNLTIAGINFVNGTGVSATGAANPGMPLGVFAFSKVPKPENRFMPWAGLTFTPEGTIIFQAVNRSAAAAGLDLLFLTRSSPCEKFTKNMLHTGAEQATISAALASYQRGIGR